MDEQIKLVKAQHDLKRWLTRLKRAATMVDKLQSKCNRLNRKIGGSQFSGTKQSGLGSPVVTKPEKTTALVEQAPLPPNTEVTAIPAALLPDSLDIPKDLLRSKLADEATRAEIAAEIEARKASKAKASKAKSQAKAKGELRKMPLQGKAALAFLAQK